MNRYLIIGQGGIGGQVARVLSRKDWVVGVSRSLVGDMDDLQNFVHWQKDALALTADELQDFTHVAVIVSPSTAVGDRVQAYQESYLAICQHLANLSDGLSHIRQVLFVSSTAVYGEDEGQIIDEWTQVRPKTPTAQVLYQAEGVLREAFGQRAIVVRPSGIYGKNRQRMVRLATAAHLDGVPSSHYTNRIMDVDLVAVLVRILQSDSPKPVYLATDFCPVSSLDVLTYLCDLMDLPPPTALNQPISGKKIISNLPKQWLRFADYRQGYAWILADGISDDKK